MRNWRATGTVHGGPAESIVRTLHIVCGRMQARPGAAKRARLAHNRRVERGQQSDHHQQWSVDCVVAVRRRPLCKGFALDACLRWVGDWEDTWTPVNKVWMPSAALRAEARAMFSRSLQPASGGVPPVTRPRGDLPSSRTRAAVARGLYANPAQGADDEFADLRELIGQKRARLAAETEVWRDVHADMKTRMDTGVRVNYDLVKGGGAGASNAEGALSPLASDSDLDSEDSSRHGNGGGQESSDVDSEGSGASRGSTASSDLQEGTAYAKKPAGVRLRLERERDDATIAYAYERRVRDADQLIRAPRVATRLSQLRKAQRSLVTAGYSGHQRAGAATRQGVCEVCGDVPAGPLCGACTCAVLGLRVGGAALRDFCRAPSCEALAHVLQEVDVAPNGSCWSFAALAQVGTVDHVASDDRPPRASRASSQLCPSADDRLRDALLRIEIAHWLDVNDGFVRFCDGDRTTRSDDEVIERLMQIPAYTPEGVLLKAGSYGGDQEFVAVADLMGCVLFTFSAGSTGDVLGTRYENGALDARGRRGRWVTATLSATVEFCAVSHTRLLCLMQTGAHWHTLLPVDADGVIVRRCRFDYAALSARDGDDMERAQQCVNEADAAAAPTLHE